MKVEDIKGYSDTELRTIRENLMRENIDDLPYKIGKFITENNDEIGNVNTRINRVMSLVAIEAVSRFLNDTMLKLDDKEISLVQDAISDSWTQTNERLSCVFLGDIERQQLEKKRESLKELFKKWSNHYNLG